MLIDTHSHLFLEEFSDDLPQVMERARQAGVSRIYMPNIDSTTIEPMLSVCADYPDFCYRTASYLGERVIPSGTVNRPGASGSTQ